MLGLNAKAYTFPCSDVMSLNHVVMSKYIFECFQSFAKSCEMKLWRDDLLNKENITNNEG